LAAPLDGAGPAKGTQQRESEDEQEHEQKHLDVHEAFSWLKIRRRDRFLLSSKNKDCRECLSSGLGKKDELSTTERGCTGRRLKEPKTNAIHEIAHLQPN
jgi:hypothetical protein